MYLLCFVFTNEIDTRIDTRFDFAPDRGTKQGYSVALYHACQR